MEEEKNVATAESNCPEQTDYLEQARKLADSYRLLVTGLHPFFLKPCIYLEKTGEKGTCLTNKKLL